MSRTARSAAVVALFTALCAAAFTTGPVTASAHGSINWDTAPASAEDSINWD
ncbi:hypothetical protein ACH4XT_13730 [Streptomyces avidinii]|uniref:hypothetical protein n=1 Tax=Streptomyces avidinii TaxID=1895 RepID=UPI0037B1976E